MSFSVLELIDLQKYPVHDLNGASGEALLAECIQSMRHAGYCNLPGFILPDALNLMMDEIQPLLAVASRGTIRRNVYGRPDDESLPASHPLRRFFEHHPLQLANDQIPAHFLLNQVYRSQYVINLVTAIQEKEKLYTYADEFQALNVVALDQGEWHGWHFDYNECTVTLLLQASEEGGEFIFAPNIRSSQDDAFDSVEKFLDGNYPDTIQLGRDAGTLTLFRGEFSIHGVTRIDGPTPRVTSIFAYDERPGRVAEDRINIQIYGDRVREILATRNSHTDAK